MNILAIIGIVSIIFWVICNLVTSKTKDVSEMENEYIKGQCVIGKICTNIFYSFAWFLKAVRFVVLLTIK